MFKPKSRFYRELDERCRKAELDRITGIKEGEMTETVFRCKDCEFYPKRPIYFEGKAHDFIRECLQTDEIVNPYDPPCEEFKLRKGGEK